MLPRQMKPVTKQEINEALLFRDWNFRNECATRLREHGIAQDQEAVEVRLFDSQWINVVNHDNAYRDWDKTDAINHAVNMTERLIAENVAKDSSPHCKTTQLNIQQLIGEIDKWRTRGVDTYPTMTEILDKYRGVK